MGRKSILDIITIRRDSSHVKFFKAWRKSKTRSLVDSLCLHVEGEYRISPLTFRVDCQEMAG